MATVLMTISNPEIIEGIGELSGYLEDLWLKSSYLQQHLHPFFSLDDFCGSKGNLRLGEDYNVSGINCWIKIVFRSQNDAIEAVKKYDATFHPKFFEGKEKIQLHLLATKEDLAVFDEIDSLDREIDNQKKIPHSSMKIVSDFKEMLLSEEDSDIKIIVGEKVIKAHKAILCCRSPFFKDILNTRIDGEDEGEVRLNNVDPDIVEGVIEYIYCGILPKDASHLLEVSRHFQLSDLSSQCEEVLLDAMDEQVITLEEFAKADDLNIEYLKKKFLDILILKGKEALVDGWKEKITLKQKQEILEAIIGDMKDEKECTVMIVTENGRETFLDNFERTFKEKLVVLDIQSRKGKEYYCSCNWSSWIKIVFQRKSVAKMVTKSSSQFFPENLSVKSVKLMISKNAIENASNVKLQVIEKKKKIENLKKTTEPSMKIFNDFKDLLLSEEYSDIKIVAGNKVISAHKAILCCRSMFFKKMFNSNMQEKERKEVHLGDIDPDVVEGIVNYIYCGRLEHFHERSLEFLEASERFLMTDLKDYCEEMLLESLNVENVLDVYVCADHCNAQHLKKECLEVIVGNMGDVFLGDWKKKLSEVQIEEVMETIYK